VVLTGVPVIPDRDEAREWAERELARPEYAAAEPTPLDRIAQGIRDVIASIFGSEAPAGLGSVVLVVLAVLVIALIVTAFIIWGRPRAVRRATTPFAALFGEEESRTAAQLRRLAAEQADAGEFTTAVVLRMRALARGLQERGLVDPPPGATVHAFARAAARVFPHRAAELESAADVFDDVRYLRRPGTAAAYAQVARTDEQLAAEHPAPSETSDRPDALATAGPRSAPR